ncbi:MAG: phosphate uptake regulator PhoU [Archaeoglobus sp.]|nr:phosphate uptake regulator PhoU [Archaeoglobus sp.]
MKVRKLQLVGRTSYMVSIPKEWISKYRLKQGDEIILQEHEEFVIIKPSQKEREEIRVEVDRIPSYDKTSLKRLLSSVYSLGVDRVVLQHENIGKHITEVSEISHKFIGMEVLDHTNNSIVLHIFTIPDFDVVTIIKRMHQILSGILNEIKRNLFTRELETVEIVNDKINRYKEDFNRFYLLAIRLVNRRMREIPISEWDELRFMLGARMIAKFYEEIADTLRVLSYYLWEHSIDVRKEIHGFIVELGEALDQGFEAFMKSDIAQSQNYISFVEGILDEIQKSIKTDQEGAILKELLIQIYRMLESIGDVSFTKNIREILKP